MSTGSTFSPAPGTLVATNEFGFSVTDPLLGNPLIEQMRLSASLTTGDEYAIPGMIDTIQALAANPKLLPFYVRSGSLSLDKVLKFLNESGVGADLITRDLGERDQFPFLVGPNWLVTFVNYFMGFRQIDVDTEETWIPVSEIHCPDLAGCALDFQFSTTRKDQGVFKICALGFSGGGGYTKTIKNISEGKIVQKSAQLQAKAELRARIFENDGQERLLCLDVVKIFDETRYVEIDVSDFYNVPLDEVLADGNLRAVSADLSLQELFEPW